MKCLVLVVALAAVAFARPDVSHLSGYNHKHSSDSGYDYKPPVNTGYDYKPPATSYGVPIQPVPAFTRPTGSYLPPNQGLPRPDSHVDFNSHYHSESSYNDAAYNPTLIQDQKHVYYFAAADEREEKPRLRINIVPSHQKNTNVIFVKAPGYEAPIPEVHAPPSHIEDKTKVVVLVKKPEEQGPINIPAPPPIKHGKPDVLVVKYKNPHEVEGVVSAATGGSNVHQLRDKHTFVQTLEAEKHHGTVGNTYLTPRAHDYSSHSSDAVVSFVGERNGRNEKDSKDSFGGLSSSGGAIEESFAIKGDSGKDVDVSFGSSGGSLDSGSSSSSLGGGSSISSFGSGGSSDSSKTTIEIHSEGKKTDSSFGGSDSFKEGESHSSSSFVGDGHSSGSLSSFEAKDGEFDSSSLSSHVTDEGRGSDSGRSLKITVETTGDGNISGSSVKSAVQEDSSFSKYGTPGESGPYYY